MIYVPIKDGLGNQMFGYAYYLYLKSKDKEVRLLWRDFSCGVHHHGVELKRAFPQCEVKVPFYLPLYLLFDFLANRIPLFKRQIFKLIEKADKKRLIYTQQNPFSFDNFSFEENKDYVMRGSWQNKSYLEGIRPLLLSQFKVDENKVIDSSRLQEIRSSQSVSIHVRRGDYLNPKNAGLQTIRSTDYFFKAIEIIEAECGKNCIFYIFSDDIAWCRQQFKGDKFRFVTENVGRDSYLDLFLMSQCKCNIISNSTFSWWGAWLNNHENKIVVAPSLWTREGVTSSSFCPSDWIFINA